MMFEKLEGSDSMQHIRPVGLSSTGLGKEGFVEGTGSFHDSIESDTSFVSFV
jgi:hypothetical protein